MQADTTLEDVHRELADEHRSIMRVVSQLREERHVEALPRLLDELHHKLIDHFAHEQFPGGLYERMGARGPSYVEDIKVLVREHCVILSGVRALLERSRVAADAAEERVLLDEVQDMIRMLAEHEEREHRLVERVKRGD